MSNDFLLLWPAQSVLRYHCPLQQEYNGASSSVYERDVVMIVEFVCRDGVLEQGEMVESDENDRMCAIPIRILEGWRIDGWLVGKWGMDKVGKERGVDELAML